MALNKTQLKQDLIIISEQLFNDSPNISPAQARETWATAMSNAIESFVKSGDGVYQNGRLQAGSTPVTPVGSPAIKIV